jgi:hypothetical protein
MLRRHFQRKRWRRGFLILGEQKKEKKNKDMSWQAKRESLLYSDEKKNRTCF